MGTLRNVLKKRLTQRQESPKSPDRTRKSPRQIYLVRRIPGGRVGEVDSPKPSKQSETRNGVNEKKRGGDCVSG